MTNQWSHGAKIAFVLAAAVTFAGAANAVPVSDPAGDFIPTYAGATNGDLDVVSAQVTFDGSNFNFSATMNAPIGTTASSVYVLGFHRGAGIANFSAIGLPNVIFDAVVTVTGTGVTGGRDLVANAPITLPAGAASINGNTIGLVIPLAALSSLGFMPNQYLWNLWPRDSSVAPGNTQISDFAPDATDAPITTPVPAALPLFVSGLGALGIVGWRRRRKAAAAV